MPKNLVVIISLLFVSTIVHGEERALKEFRGVVTLHLLPAKVIQVNELIENPEPDTSYIGSDGILVDLDENPDVTANWSIVTIKYYQYEEPKPIRFSISADEDNLITVNYHAVDVKVEGDLSKYIR